MSVKAAGFTALPGRDRALPSGAIDPGDTLHRPGFLTENTLSLFNLMGYCLAHHDYPRAISRGNCACSLE
jgi:hypothetical protein